MRFNMKWNQMKNLEYSNSIKHRINSQGRWTFKMD